MRVPTKYTEKRNFVAILGTEDSDWQCTDNLMYAKLAPFLPGRYDSL